VVVLGPADRPARPGTQHDYHHDMKVKPEAATAVIELLIMRGKTPETCWAVNKRQDNKLENCCIWLVIYLNYLLCIYPTYRFTLRLLCYSWPILLGVQKSLFSSPLLWLSNTKFKISTSNFYNCSSNSFLSRMWEPPLSTGRRCLIAEENLVSEFSDMLGQLLCKGHERWGNLADLSFSQQCTEDTRLLTCCAVPTGK